MATAIMIPSSGELGSRITLVRWLVRPGDAVGAGAPLAEIEADKGVLEVEAPAPGTVLVLFRDPGATVEPGTVLGYLGEPGEEPPAAARTQRPPLAAPATRRLAASLGVDLRSVIPSGAEGVVTRGDVQAAARGQTAARAGAADPGTGAGALGRPLTPNQRTVAARVSRSHREIPPVHFTTRVDARRAAELRSGGIGYTALFVFAASRTLARFPAFRSRLQGEQLVTSEGAHVAFAVADEAAGELFTPVLRDAERLDLEGIDSRVRELAGAARARRLGPEAYAGGSFLVTNLGKFAVDSFDPIIHPGHSGALAVGAVQMLPTAAPGPKGWGVEIRPALTLTLAVDHRLVNGVEAARALSWIKEISEGRTQ